MKVTITGVKEIDRALRTLAPKLARKVIRQAIRKALKPVKSAVERDAPRRSGALASSVKIKAAPRKRGRIEIDVTIGAGNFKGATFYAAMVELGTKHQKPQHYMREAFDDTKGPARDTAISEIRKGIEREAKTK